MRLISGVSAAVVSFGQLAHAGVPFVGGPTFDAVAGTGATTPQGQLYLKNGLSAGDGIAVAPISKTASGQSLGFGAVRFDAVGATALQNLGATTAGVIDVALADAQSGPFILGSSRKYVGGVDLGLRPVRWDSNGIVYELPYNGPASSNGFGFAVAATPGGVTVGQLMRSVTGATGFVDSRPVRWNAAGTTVTPLEILGTDSSGNTSGLVAGITPAGVTYGSVDQYVGNIKQGRVAVRWSATGTAVTPLGTIGNTGHASSTLSVRAVNDAGIAVGQSTAYAAGGAALGNAATRWNADGTADALAGLRPLAFSSDLAWDVNASGTAVGMSEAGGPTATNLRAVRWEAGGTAVTSLGVLPGTISASWAHDINDAGLAVGTQRDSSAYGIAVLWLNDGTAVDLNTFISPTSGWTLIQANSISETNWVGGVGLFDPDGTGPAAAYQRAFLLQVPEPAWTGVIGAAAAAAFSRSRRPSRREWGRRLGESASGR